MTPSWSVREEVTSGPWWRLPGSPPQPPLRLTRRGRLALTVLLLLLLLLLIALSAARFPSLL